MLLLNSGKPISHCELAAVLNARGLRLATDVPCTTKAACSRCPIVDIHQGLARNRSLRYQVLAQLDTGRTCQ
jgi:hypothetical protein